MLNKTRKTINKNMCQVCAMSGSTCPSCHTGPRLAQRGLCVHPNIVIFISSSSSSSSSSSRSSISVVSMFNKTRQTRR